MHRYDLNSLFCPKTVALVGASERSSFSDKLVRNNDDWAYPGKLYFVNPRRDTVFGQPCYPGLSHVPDTIDVAVITIPVASVLDVVREGIGCGVKHFVINTAGFAEASEEGIARQNELERLCKESGVGVVGPNCLGLINVKDHVILFGAALPGCLHAGNVGAITQSGSISIALMNNGHKFGFTYIASTGNEVVLSTEDLLEFYIEDPDTQVIALFLESIHYPDRFLQAARHALRVGKPIVALKVGLSDHGKQISKGHTGALAGSARVNEAALRKVGIIQVYDLDEMMETIELLSCVRQTDAAGVAIVSISGGGLALSADICERFNIPLARFSDDTKNGVRKLMNLGDLVPVMNPYDAGAGWIPRGFAERFLKCIKLLADDPNVDLLVVQQQSQASIPPLQVDYYHTIARATAECFHTSNKAIVYTSDVAAGFHEDIVHHIKATGMPLLQSVSTALKAISHLGTYRRFAKEEQACQRAPKSTYLRTIIESMPPDRKLLGENDAKRILERYGISIAQSRLASTAHDAVTYAAQIGYPVVMKIDSPDIIHKSDIGGVLMDLSSCEDVTEAYHSMMTTVKKRCPLAKINGVLICEQHKVGTELILGIKQDEQFGPVIMIGLGGILAEALDLVALALPPFTKQEAKQLIHSFKGSSVLGEFRGTGPKDIDSVADAIVALGELGIDGKGYFSELDINPLLVYENGCGCVALDARIIL